jgi:hypothetical protein
MSNSILTPTQVTRETLRILHQKLRFIGTINRQYDKSFAEEGAKIGDSLKIRLPNQYTVTSGATMSAQDTSETSVTLQVSTQKHVGMTFTSADLTLSLDDFSKRIIEPAMAVLAASVEADALSMYKDVYNISDEDTVAFTLKSMLLGRALLLDNLTPMDDQWAGQLSTLSAVKFMDAVKGLFQDSQGIKEQYREGKIGRTSGADWYENTLLAPHTTGTAAKTTGYTVSGANQTGATMTITGGSTTFLVGDVVTLAGCYRVHPETKVSTGVLQQFVVTADSGASATSLAISPSIVITGARQNVSAAPTDTGAVVKVAAGASEIIRPDLIYHKDAFAFATADLVLPKGVHFAAREVYDGISLRVVRQYDINNDKLPCRVDILYGKKAIRPQLASRIHADG